VKIRIFSDDTVDLNLPAIQTGLANNSPSITWSLGKAKVKVGRDYIEFPESYKSLPKSIVAESVDDDLVFIFTEKPYDNNYFWDSGLEKTIIVSLFGWDHLTTLSRNNGAVYFIVAILVRVLGIGRSHKEKNTGCINDFWMDKTGVDSGMRSAFICPKCLPPAKNKLVSLNGPILKELNLILDQLSSASRANKDVSENWSCSKSTSAFQVFLCHNSQDKAEIRALNKELKSQGIMTWFDEEQLPPGRAWQELLEQQIQDIGSAAILVGESGLGPWQNSEMRAFISEFVERKCPVIPVVLKSCKTVPQLPLFLRQFTWVDFRKPEPDPIERLLWGITGTKPQR
jgi:hypothetical protein